MSVKVVIGAGFGDEGKGKLVDYLATSDSLVVRHSGGANAGHTVETDTHRHVFSHFGSGTFKTARTLLSKYFISNPYGYHKEFVDLTDFGVYLSVDPRGLLTTPYDIMINQMIEEQRGDKRHGSCGVGINETIRRSEAGFKLSICDIKKIDFRDRLVETKIDWVPRRIEELGIVISDKWKARLDNHEIMFDYLKKLQTYRFQSDYDHLLINTYDDVIFEGSQGLMLDQSHRFFPYVTPVNTGIKNVVSILEETMISEIDVIYVFRVYATRHGQGPFYHEQKDMSFEDKTNIPNEWQKSLRFGYLDLDLISESIHQDMVNKKDLKINPFIAINCFDQVDTITCMANGKKHVLNQSKFIELVEKNTEIKVKYIGNGPKRNNILEI